MRIHLASDLHIEAHVTKTIVAGAGLSEDVVCLIPGDWANGLTLNSQLAGYGYDDVANPHHIPILALFGNHEWYGLDMEKHEADLREEASYAGVTLLDRERFQLGEWTVLGCTLWSNFALHGEAQAPLAAIECGRSISDFQQITIGGCLMTPQDSIRMYERDHAWLDQELAKCDPVKTIVMTHFGPHPDSTHPMYKVADYAHLNPYFTNNSGLIEKHQPALWVHGHTHQRLAYSVGRTQVVCNPRGYSSEWQEWPFDPELILEPPEFSPPPEYRWVWKNRAE